MNTQLGHPDVVNALLAAIRQSEKQMISFRDFMNICLYSEPGGYYRNPNSKIGKDGDFYTSSSIGSVMGEMVAAYICSQISTETSSDDPIHLVEWGGGNGRLALHLLNEIKLIAPSIFSRLSYTIIESSGFHRGLQRQTLEQHIDLIQFMSENEWFTEGSRDNVYVLANELLDAFPVHRIRFQDRKFQESYVSWNAQEQIFEENWLPLDAKPLLDYIDRLEVQWAEGQVAELNLAAEAWVGSVAAHMISGSCMIIDYGDREEELYAAHRHQGTLLCYRKHQAHDNPFIALGEQDITSHVNFTSCIDSAHRSGFTTCTLQTQREFLVEQGILQKLQDHFDPNPFSEVSKRNRAIRQLLLSDQMSELFKVFIAKKKR
ncbi:class I SAM-dependent methyltransferase [Paenibacillus sedimenti]|uniref:SAM-dependent methyltransferase n=1 Tax=Paenibacillus sedimenti TaxID=2770274 RepID=A0A926KJX8_9BACL|nr:SAM-dependent methyltransferase [Paenibacillus sedimenti]MBD0379157.1 SAM-dependent methyltransferase [Paenibacillus sedimenti]